MVPTAELIRFYYAPSMRLAQGLFWGEYIDTFDSERSGVFGIPELFMHSGKSAFLEAVTSDDLDERPEGP